MCKVANQENALISGLATILLAKSLALLIPVTSFLVSLTHRHVTRVGKLKSLATWRYKVASQESTKCALLFLP